MEIDPQDQSILFDLFKAVRGLVFAEGGDGWALVVSTGYRVLADLFQKYEAESGKWFLERYDDPGQAEVRFSHQQEHIVFRADLGDFAGYEVVINLGHRWGTHTTI